MQRTVHRKWLFRIGALLLPFALVALLEAGLRLAGYGRPTTFFLKQTIQGKERLVENPQFGFRFFPAGVARSPTPIVMPAKKEPGTIRIFLFGESAALGDPKPAFGMGRYLETLLAARYPAKKFEVICVAMTAINSHVILPIARECAEHEGDLWILYMGNNEMIGPYGGATRKGKLPPLLIIRAGIYFKSTRTGQLFGSLAGRFSSNNKARQFEGLQLFSENKIAPDDPVRARVDKNFEANLKDIVAAGQRAGAKVIGSSVAVNLADCAPHASVHNGSAGFMSEWEKHFSAGIVAQNENRPIDALQNFKNAEKIDAGFAELHFREAMCLLQATNVAEARKEFQTASDFDALSFRCASGRNEIIRRVAREKNISFARLDETIAQQSERNIAGQETFLDHVHFNFLGNYTAARALAGEVEKTLSLSAGKTNWLAETDCESQLALTDWNRFLAFENMSMRLAEGVFTNQITNAKSREMLREKMNECRRRVKEMPVEDIYKTAAQNRPDDFYIKQNYAEYLELRNNLAGAREQWRKVADLLPHHPVAFYQAGRLGIKLGKIDEALPDLQQALRIRPDFLEARLEMAQAYRKTGKNTEAMAELRHSLQQYPASAQAHFQLADVLAAIGQKSQAMVELATALRYNPDYWEAHYLIGVENAVLGDLPSAEAQFREVTRLKPDFALGHFNLGVALARQKRWRDAEPVLEKAVSLDTNNISARKQLELVREILALPQLQEKGK